MAEASKIEWTDATWQPITGCTVVSPGCTNCYAMRLAGTRLRHHPSRAGLTRDTKAGPVWTGEVRLNREWLVQPLSWRRPRRIFVCAHGDLFHESVPDEWIDLVFAVMCLVPWHTFQVLTKRPDRMRAYFAETWQPAQAQRIEVGPKVLDIPAERRPGDRWDQIDLAIDSIPDDILLKGNRFWTPAGSLIGRPAWPRVPLRNVWMGVSVEDQRRADERIPDLLATPAAIRFLSCEPLLSALDLSAWLGVHHHPDNDLSNPETAAAIGRVIHAARRMMGGSVDWVITGSESGPGARPCDLDWVRLLRDQCQATGVPFFWKQHVEAGRKLSLPELDGRQWHELPR